jgi:type I restriction enzyme S subunit
MKEYSEYKEYHGVQYPSQWQCSVFKRFCTLISGNSNVEELTHGEIPFIRVSDMNLPQNAKVITTSTTFVKRYGNERNIFPIGSVIFPKRGGAILTNKRRIVAIDVCCDLNIMGAIPCKKVVPEYLYYYLLSKDFSLLVDGSAIPQINKGDIEPLVFTLPSLAEQQHIVSFLDKKTAKIDEYIDKKNKEIEALKEWKKALIAHVVTKGLNTNAKMKKFKSLLSDETPSHWKIVRNKNIFESHYEAVSSRKNIPLLSLTTEGVILRDVSTGKGKFPKDFEMYNVVYPNNIIFCLFDLDETPRTVGLCYNYGMITNAYTTFKIKDTVLPEYITNYYLAVDNIKALRPYYSGLRKVVQSNRFNSIQIPLPPIEEQKEIVEYIDAATTKADKMIVELTNHVESMKEYKQRLIADVVTGKINVQPCNTCL